MTKYSFSGKIVLGKKKHSFERTIQAESEKQAKDTLYSQLGSEHSIKRSKITIEDIKEA